MTVTALQALALVGAIEEIARDVARIRRRLAGDDYGSHLVDRVALRVDGLDAFVQPTAGELVRLGYPVDAALATIDARAARLRSLLGEAA